MSILIRGMEIPKRCDDCRIMVFEDTNCAPELYCGCPIVFKAHPQGVDHRPDYCPLIPVQPHGRLIDADAVVAEIDSYIDNMAYSYPYLLREEQSQREHGMVFARDIVCDAPTIIEAEEGET